MTTPNEAPALATVPSRPGRQGPPLPLPALSWAVLTVLAAALYPGVRPNQDATTTLEVLRGSHTGTVAGMVLVASAVPLLIWSAAMHQRLTVLGVRVAGPSIGLVGGVLAAVALAVGGLAGWVAALTADLGDAPLSVALSRLAFGAGGPLFDTGLGLALAGSAVPLLILRLVPRPLAWTGVVLAALGGLTLLVLVVPVLGPMLPVARFGGLIWVVITSFLLPRARPRRSA